jgi:diphosphomevalonate decarboxylase
MSVAATIATLLRERRRNAPRRHATAYAPANVALVKYWGKRDESLNLPRTASLSVSLGALGTHTGVRPIDGPADRITLNDAPVAPESSFARRIVAFLDLLRPADGPRLEVKTRNTVPTAAGLASSASGFAALVMALDRLYDWQLPPPSLSVLARLGSGSACRSVYPGFVLWRAGEQADGLDSVAEPLDVTWPDLRVGVITVSTADKGLGSRPAMRRTVETSPLYAAWPGIVDRDLAEIQTALGTRDFTHLGVVAERNALAMHATMLGAWPPILFWQAGTVEALQRLWRLRDDGLAVYATLDAGPNIKVLHQAADQPALAAAFPGIQVIAPFA